MSKKKNLDLVKLEVAVRKGTRRIQSLHHGKAVWPSDVMLIALHVGEELRGRAWRILPTLPECNQ